MKSVAILSFLATILLAGSASAQSSEITFYAGGFLGESFIIKPPALFEEVEAVFDDDFTGGIRYAYFLNSHIALEAGAGFTPSSILAKGSFSGGTNAAAIVNVDTYVLHANVVAHLFRGPVIPFVTAGVGAVHFAFQTAGSGFLTPSETDFAWNAGGGFKIPIRPSTALRFEGRFYWMKPEFSVDDTSRFVEISGGLSILFDF